MRVKKVARTDKATTSRAVDSNPEGQPEAVTSNVNQLELVVEPFVAPLNP